MEQQDDHEDVCGCDDPDGSSVDDTTDPDPDAVARYDALVRVALGRERPPFGTRMPVLGAVVRGWVAAGEEVAPGVLAEAPMLDLRIPRPGMAAAIVCAPAPMAVVAPTALGVEIAWIHCTVVEERGEQLVVLLDPGLVAEDLSSTLEVDRRQVTTREADRRDDRRPSPP